jgi:hypothetical protein
MLHCHTWMPYSNSCGSGGGGGGGGGSITSTAYRYYYEVVLHKASHALLP